MTLGFGGTPGGCEASLGSIEGAGSVATVAVAVTGGTEVVLSGSGRYLLETDFSPLPSGRSQKCRRISGVPENP